MAVTRSDVARAAGVSPAVVSYVLNNGPRPVAPSTRARVLDAVAALDYRPNAIASALRGGSTQTVGLLTPNRSDPFLGELAEAVEQTLSQHGYMALTGSTYGNTGIAERLLRTFLDRKVDGIIVAPGVSVVGAALQAVEQPLVILERLANHGPFSTVCTDDLADAATTVAHLQVHGHRHIGCISGPPHSSTEALRLQGWRETQRGVGHPYGDGLVAFGEVSEEGGYQAASTLLSEHGRPWAVYGRAPSALFVASDVQAIGALSACWELGLRVPDDIAIASMGGTRAARYAIPALTTMRQDVEYLASAACARLLLDIRQPGSEPSHGELTGNLVIGRTCGC
jgi:LacI family transcriptional regulator